MFSSAHRQHAQPSLPAVPPPASSSAASACRCHLRLQHASVSLAACRSLQAPGMCRCRLLCVAACFACLVNPPVPSALWSATADKLPADTAEAPGHTWSRLVTPGHAWSRLVIFTGLLAICFRCWGFCTSLEGCRCSLLIPWLLPARRKGLLTDSAGESRLQQAWRLSSGEAYAHTMLDRHTNMYAQSHGGLQSVTHHRAPSAGCSCWCRARQAAPRPG